jgi:hypothetical protein
MSLIEKQFSVFFNSSVSSGSVKIGSLGNRFQVQLDTPLSIPADSLYASLEVVSTKIWNVSPNISTTIGNNQLYFSFEGYNFNIQFPDGLYSVDELNKYISIYFNEYTPLPNDLFLFSENQSTQKVSIQINYIGVMIDFRQPNSCIDVLGFYTTHDQQNDIFTSTLVLDSVVAGASFVAPNEARFNRVVNYYLLSNLLSDGIPINSRSVGILAEIPVDVSVGSLINFSPFNPLKIDANDLIGNSKQLISFTLLDHLLRDVSTAGEEWSLTLVFRYYVKI